MTNSALPGQVQRATEQAARAGFTMSCHPDTGRLLAVLAAAVPSGGRVLELGAGTGVGTAWIVHGLAERCERKTAEVCRRLLDHPDLISLEIASSTGLILSTRRRPD